MNPKPLAHRPLRSGRDDDAGPRGPASRTTTWPEGSPAQREDARGLSRPATQIRASDGEHCVQRLRTERPIVRNDRGLAQREHLVAPDPARLWQLAIGKVVIGNGHTEYGGRDRCDSNGNEIAMAIGFRKHDHGPPLAGLEVRVRERDSDDLTTPSGHSRHRLPGYPRCGP